MDFCGCQPANEGGLVLRTMALSHGFSEQLGPDWSQLLDLFANSAKRRKRYESLQREAGVAETREGVNIHYR